jgi:uncharacterized membrane protein (UPF0127 family)
MIKQLFLPLVAVAAFVVIVGILSQQSGNINIGKYVPSFATASPVPKESAEIGGKTISIEVVKTESDRQKGLSGRSFLDSGSGMLFAFNTKNVSPIFWMKDMQIPVDIIWIRNEKVTKIDKDVPVPAQSTNDSNLIKYNGGNIDYVIEVNAGFTSQNNIKVGDQVTLPSGL